MNIAFSPALRDALTKWLDHLVALDGASAHTIKAYRADTTAFLTFLGQHLGGSTGIGQITGVTQSDMRAFMAHERGRGTGARSLARTLSAVKGFARWLAEREGFEPTAILAARSPKFRRKLPRPLSEEAARNLIRNVGDFAREDWVAARDMAVVTLLYGCGLRISEALNLTLSDVLPDGVLHIRKTKFGKSRMVPLHPSMMNILDQYLELRMAVVAEDDHLFLSEGKRQIYYSVPQKAFHEILAIAGIAPGRPRRPRIHDLRHTFATRVLEQCGAGHEAIARHAVALMTYMGHSNLRYTYWYLHRTPELMAEIAAAAENLLMGERQ